MSKERSGEKEWIDKFAAVAAVGGGLFGLVTGSGAAWVLFAGGTGLLIYRKFK